MARICFIPTKFQVSVSAIIDAANLLLAEFEKDNMTATVRQIYYQFIGNDLFPDSWIDEKYNRENGLQLTTKNTLKNYKRLARILNDGRMAGRIDWKMIEDRTRYLRSYGYTEDPAQAIRFAGYSYAEDIWRDQPNYCEVWIEKDALVGVIEKPCNEFRVPFFSTRGYMSQSEAYVAGERIRAIAAEGKRITILHAGDHDPSGLNMSKDNEDRLLMFGRQGNIDFRRIALNLDQVQQYKLPPNPAKETDSRYATYEQEFGPESWELDALKHRVIWELVSTNIKSILDQEKFDAALEQERENKKIMTKLADNWEEVRTLLGMIDE